MPRLLLFRHAKAERTQPGSTDHDRALTKSARKDSAEMGKAIAAHGPVDLVLSSTARRARETWDLASATLGGSPEVRLLRSIYDADDYLPILRAEGGDAKTVLLIGHNPAMQETAAALVADRRSADSATLAAGFPKATVAVLDFGGSWAELSRGDARLTVFLLPQRE
ncbi:MAG: SixA phosphatase family protein [Propylenella sp.]